MPQSSFGGRELYKFCSSSRLEPGGLPWNTGELTEDWRNVDVVLMFKKEKKRMQETIDQG